ncbi:ATP-binding protein [Nonomuraea aurantiaca]|uniref:ATP-binding protein n=1 Tax=Nonomuraea aurantiaca TaxID=2878562 RepID=UPI001CD928C2|nr:ATP-binding protein [Nonomuraea aurantiaca]MCA2225218.1 ATP-binding protein [Nonomuraea aurantiaca]
MTEASMRLVGDRRFPGCPEVVSDVRIYAARWLVMELPRAADDANLLDNVRLLVTEIATNAIRHTISGRWSNGAFRVRMWLGNGGRIRVEVRDQGWWSGPRLRSDANETGGRGLRILAAVAMKWGVRRHWFGRTVWFELLAQAPVAASPAYLDAPEPIVDQVSGRVIRSCG